MPVALTLHQPWATLVVSGIKRVENRTWSTPHRGELWIHAGRVVDADAVAKHRALLPSSLPMSALVGSVRLVDCVRGVVDEWAIPGYWHWLLDDARALRVPIEMRGQPKLFELPRDVVERLRRDDARDGQH